jgi:cobalt-zinc-cadmium efflux system outer membrane protein
MPLLTTPTGRPSPLAGLAVVIWLVGLTQLGCRGPAPAGNPHYVTQQLGCRTGFTPERVAPCRYEIPSGVVIDDGLSEDEAVHIALTNNSAFQATLAQLGMAGGDALQASLLANPQLLVYFPTSIKEGQYTLFAPIESFLLRPARVKIANEEYRRVGQQLVQNGLDLARDVRIAYVDFALASEQSRLADEALRIRGSILDLTERRLEEGDISELETLAARVDRLNAQAATGVQRQAIAIAEARLASLIGLPLLEEPLVPLALTPPRLADFDESELIAKALACRPDYHAACWAVAAASRRSRLSRWLFLRLDGVLDIRTQNGPTRTGPGIRLDVPIFNRNQGAIVRADWEVNAAMHARDAIRDQIIQDVRTALRQLRQARDNLILLENEVAPALSEALEIAQRGFADGGTNYLLVLQTTSQYLDARARILDQRAALTSALAELERSVGCSLNDTAMDVEALVRETAPPTDLNQEIEELTPPSVEPLRFDE